MGAVLIGTRCRRIIRVKVDVTNRGIVKTIAKRFCIGFKYVTSSVERESKNISPGDSSLRTGSIWLAFVTGKNVLDGQKCFITYHIVGWITNMYIIKLLSVEFALSMWRKIQCQNKRSNWRTNKLQQRTCLGVVYCNPWSVFIMTPDEEYMFFVHDFVRVWIRIDHAKIETVLLTFLHGLFKADILLNIWIDD